MRCSVRAWTSAFSSLFSAHRFRPFTGEPPINVFLDICCIAQDDEKAKAVGIASIGAILDRSQQRYARPHKRHYFNRLWCTFELAAYHRRAGRSRLDLVHSTPLRFIGLFVMFSCFYEITVLTTYATAFLFPYSADKSSDASSFFYDGGGDFGYGLLVIVYARRDTNLYSYRGCGGARCPPRASVRLRLRSTPDCTAFRQATAKRSLT